MTVNANPILNRRRRRRVSPVAVAAAAVIAFAGSADAAYGQIQRSTINPGWEENDPPGDPSYRIYNDADVPGWENSTNRIEIWDTNFQGVVSAEGTKHAELNANSPGTTYQEICLVNGDDIDWAFYHRRRPGGADPQVVTLSIADSSGTVVSNITTSSVTSTSGWSLRQGTNFPFNGATGIYRFQFSTTNPGSLGNFLDGIDITVLPHVEFARNGTSVEGEANPELPTITFSGRITAPLAVKIRVTGGTATLGTDYTTPSGTADFDLIIPAGTYQGDEFELPITLLSNDGADAGENIEFEIISSPNDYDLSAVAACGGTPTSTATHTIFEEADLVTSKTLVSADAAPSGGDIVTFAIEVTNNGPSEASDATLTDLIPDGLTPTGANGDATQGSYAPSTGVWSIGALDSGSSATLTIEGTVDLDQGGNAILNTTTAAVALQPDPVDTGDDLEEGVTVPLEPGLSLTKVADDDAMVTVGQVISYTYTVTNTGTEIVRGIALTDVHNGDGPAPVPANETLLADNFALNDSSDSTANDGVWDVLAPGDVVTFVGTYTVQQADIDNLQ